MCGLLCRRSWRRSRPRRAAEEFEDRPGRVRWQAIQLSIVGGNKNKERNLGGQNCPSAEEDCSDWRAFERGGVFAGDREGSRGAACGRPHRTPAKRRL